MRQTKLIILLIAVSAFLAAQTDPPGRVGRVGDGGRAETSGPEGLRQAGSSRNSVLGHPASKAKPAASAGSATAAASTNKARSGRRSRSLHPGQELLSDEKN
jgi:hypothetical protein